MAASNHCATCSIKKVDASTQCPEIVEAPSVKDLADTFKGQKQTDIDVSKITIGSRCNKAPSIMEGTVAPGPTPTQSPQAFGSGNSASVEAPPVMEGSITLDESIDVFKKHETISSRCKKAPSVMEGTITPGHFSNQKQNQLPTVPEGYHSYKIQKPRGKFVGRRGL